MLLLLRRGNSSSRDLFRLPLFSEPRYISVCRPGIEHVLFSWLEIQRSRNHPITAKGRAITVIEKKRERIIASLFESEVKHLIVLYREQENLYDFNLHAYHDRDKAKDFNIYIFRRR